MAESRALLLIADIGGYTNYMSLHRFSLAHAQGNIERLLEAVIDAAPGLELVDVEGDAAFFSRAADEAAATHATEAAVAMHRSFHEERQRLAARNLCPCEGCRQAGELTLKVVAHLGDVATQTVRHRKTLVGPDVILVHRLLKNTVPVPEYLLFSGELYRGGEARPLEQELEGLGPVQTYFVDLGELAEPLPPAPVAAWPKRVLETLRVIRRGMPHLLGLKRHPAAA